MDFLRPGCALERRRVWLHSAARASGTGRRATAARRAMRASIESIGLLPAPDELKRVRYTHFSDLVWPVTD